MAGVCSWFSKFPSFRIFSDLERSEDDTAYSGVSFAEPDDYSWPAQSVLLSLAGSGEPDDEEPQSPAGAHEPTAEIVASLVARLDEAESRLKGMPEQTLDTLRTAVSENRFAVAGTQSVAAMRRTLAFKLDPKEFYFYDYDVDVDGSRRVICDATSPLDRDKFDQIFFASSITSQAAQKIERRALVPEDVFISARAYDEVRQASLGGSQSSASRKDEDLRIRQQTQLKQCQPLIKLVALASHAFNVSQKLLEHHHDDTDPFDLADQLPLFGSMDTALQQVLHSSYCKNLPVFISDF